MRIARAVVIQRSPIARECENDFVDRRRRSDRAAVSRQFINAGRRAEERVEERDPECVTVRAKQDDTRFEGAWRGGDCDRNGHDRIGNLDATLPLRNSVCETARWSVGR
uniref:Uncharacterized protein n=1 Tax=Plectus sambesii TaxID=2011161 RepID=A0A914VY59_9BILA